MRLTTKIALVLAVPAAACAYRGVAPSMQQPLDSTVVEEAAGVDAAQSPDGVIRIQWSRQDVPVSVDGTTLPPEAGLASWAAFTAAPGGALLMGDMVLFEDEVGAALDTALANGLEVTALHNHLLYEEPRVYFMHLGGRGNLAHLAGAVRELWDAARAVRSSRSSPALYSGEGPPQPGRIDVAAIERILEHPARADKGVVRVGIGRPGRLHGVRIGPSMGLMTHASFVGSDARAVVSGNVALTAGEVQRVLQALRAHGLRVVALHNHAVGEVPAYYFAHFWGTGRAGDLAMALRAALDAQGL